MTIVIAERDAHEQFVKTLRPHTKAKRLPPCVVHAFTGTEAELQVYRCGCVRLPASMRMA